jgi:hypothetical protein
MATRIEMMINNSGAPEGVVYTIYRDTQPGLTADSPVVATVDETEVLQTAFQKIGEQLVQDPMNPFQFFASRVYETNPAPTVYIDGTPVDPVDVKLSTFSKVITLSDKYDLVANTPHVVTMDYWYLASIFRDDAHPQDGVNYFGPVANALNPVLGFSMQYDWTNFAMNLNWSFDGTPKNYYYRVRAQNRDGYLSNLSDEKMIPLAVDPATVQYMIQRSITQTGPWQTVATVPTTSFVDPDPTPVGHIPLTNWGTKQDATTAQLFIQNPWHNWQANWRPSYYYRVIPIDDEGYTADPRPVPPEYIGINIKPVKLIIRRKEDNGMPASLDGTDAVTVFTLLEPQQNPHDAVLTLNDTYVAGKVYGYTVYIIDAKGMVGQPSYFTVDMR